MPARIGEHCWYRTSGDWKGGILLSWSTDHIEYESGPGHFLVGVVEDTKTGDGVHSIPIANINFNSIRP